MSRAAQALIADLGIDEERYRRWAAGGVDEELKELVRQRELARRQALEPAPE